VKRKGARKRKARDDNGGFAVTIAPFLKVLFCSFSYKKKNAGFQ
jgi:hypothetical protein